MYTLGLLISSVWVSVGTGALLALAIAGDEAFDPRVPLYRDEYNEYLVFIVSAILGAVFFTILLVTGNTMAQAVRERTGELGVLKAIGFTNGQIMAFILAESCLLTVLGGGLGLGQRWPGQRAWRMSTPETAPSRARRNGVPSSR